MKNPRPDPKGDEQQPVELPCLNCGKKYRFALDSPEANGIFNVFCNGECEDRYAARQ